MFKVVIQFRHVHLSTADQDALFGPGCLLTPLCAISHLGQVVYEETVDLAGPRGTIESVRIIGPAREHSQVELSELEALAAGFDAPVRLSGDSQNSAQGRLLGPKGECTVDKVIIPARHLHLPDHLAENLGLRQHQRVRLLAAHNPKPAIKEVVVRVHPTFSPEFHLTADEAAVFWLNTGDYVKLA